MADAINGQLLTDELKPVGPPIQAGAHDFYLYPGALTANPANGDYLAMQLSDSHKLTAAHDVYLTRIGSDGSVAGTASSQAGTQARAGQVHATYSRGTATILSHGSSAAAVPPSLRPAQPAPISVGLVLSGRSFRAARRSVLTSPSPSPPARHPLSSCG